MIQGFRDKRLAKFWNEGDPRGVRGDLRDRVREALTVLDAAKDLREIPPGYRPHPLQGKPRRYAIDVSAQWRVTFEWHDGEASQVDLEQYH